MGCISSKMAREDLRKERELVGSVFPGGADCPNHIVSLTSSTYGVLKLDRENARQGAAMEERRIPPPSLLVNGGQKKAAAEEPEIINAWELMEDLDDEIPICPPAKKVPAKMKPLEGAVASPRKQRAVGKENLCKPERLDLDPSRVLRPLSSPSSGQRETPKSTKSTPRSLKIPFSGRDSEGSRRGFSRSPLFDPELVAFFEKDHCEEGAQIKKMISGTPRKHQRGDAAPCSWENFEKKCPPGGEQSVVLYTTTLRGIRRTFEDCNDVRAAIESHGVQIVEKDISMDSGFREEIRFLMGRREVRVPLLFVKGRLVGGAEEVLKLEEEGKLEKMLAGIPRAAACCDGCGGMRFVLCMDCCGSRKIFDEAEKKTVRCAECNENGLIRCPICG